jgi:hypothetical protein
MSATANPGTPSHLPKMAQLTALFAESGLTIFGPLEDMSAVCCRGPIPERTGCLTCKNSVELREFETSDFLDANEISAVGRCVSP